MHPTLVFLPGLLCDKAAFAHQIEALEGGWRIAVADFSNAGSIVEMALIALGVATGPLVLIGHSMGGRAALEAVRLAPERVAGLCLMDTGIAPGRPAEVPRRMELVELAYREGMAALARVWLPPMVHENRENDAGLIGPLTQMVLRASPEQHERQIRALINRPDAGPGLAAITCPVLVLVGRQDRWSPLAQHREIAAAIPGAQLGIIEDAGHFAPVEQPREVSAALAGWLGRTFAAQ